MTEEETVKEFEELWEYEYPSGTHPKGCLCIACEWENDVKPQAKRWYLVACRKRQEEKEKKMKFAPCLFSCCIHYDEYELIPKWICLRCIKFNHRNNYEKREESQ